eukprot:4676489-Pleurochrysis_carterae.AAC.4
METSSTTSTETRRHLATAPALRETLPASASGVPLPRPIPAHEWIVEPPMCDAAMPVGAVTATD